MNHLQNQTISDQLIELSDENKDYLGPDLTLNHCRVVLDTTARGLAITKVRFLGCHIETKRTLSDFQKWCKAVIEDCTFSGRFIGNDFGHWEEQAPDGRIDRCDFSGAILDGCRFMNCDTSTTKTPRWPCFTILKPAQCRKDIELLKWPAALRPRAQVMLDELEITAAITWHGPTRAKEWGVAESELRDWLGQLDGAIL